ESLYSKYRTIWKLPIAQAADLLQVHDLTRLAPAQRDSESRRFLWQDTHRPPDSSAELPFRFFLIRLSDTVNIMVVTVPLRLSTDGFAARGLLMKLGVQYPALVSVQTSPVAQDTLLVQHAERGSVAPSSSIHFWTRKVESVAGAFELPADYPRRPNAE